MYPNNAGHWNYELAHDYHERLLQQSAQRRRLSALPPVANRIWRNLQPLALLRRWRLVMPRLQWSGPADEATYN